LNYFSDKVLYCHSALYAFGNVFALCILGLVLFITTIILTRRWISNNSDDSCTHTGDIL